MTEYRDRRAVDQDIALEGAFLAGALPDADRRRDPSTPTPSPTHSPTASLEIPAMSWTTTYDSFSAFTAQVPTHETKHLDPETQAQRHAARDAVFGLVRSGALGNPDAEGNDVTIGMSGHANPGHRLTPGWANDQISITVTRKSVPVPVPVPPTVTPTPLPPKITPPITPPIHAPAHPPAHPATPHPTPTPPTHTPPPKGTLPV